MVDGRVVACRFVAAGPGRGGVRRRVEADHDVALEPPVWVMGGLVGGHGRSGEHREDGDAEHAENEEEGEIHPCSLVGIGGLAGIHGLGIAREGAMPRRNEVTHGEGGEERFDAESRRGYRAQRKCGNGRQEICKTMSSHGC